MKIMYRTSALILLLVIWLAGCKNAATSTSNKAKPVQSAPSNLNRANDQPAANGNSSTEVSKATASVDANNASKLFGTYTMSEVHSGGVVNMISQMKTELTFLSDGTYSRISKRNGKVYHSDAGEYRIEGNDRLVLLIKFAKQTIHDPPLERKHSFTLSRDGEELKMTSEDGKVAVFRKTRKA